MRKSIIAISLMILTLALTIIPVLATDARYYDWVYYGAPKDGNWQNYSPTTNYGRPLSYEWYNEFASDNPPATFGHMWFIMRFEPDGDSMRSSDKKVTLEMRLNSYVAGEDCVITFDRYSDNVYVGLCDIGDNPGTLYTIDSSQWITWFEMKIHLSMDGEHYTCMAELWKWHKVTSEKVKLDRVIKAEDVDVSENTYFLQKAEVDYGLNGGGMWTITTLMNDVGHTYDIKGIDWKCDIKYVALVSKNFGKHFSLDPDLWFDANETWKCDVDGDLDIEIKDVAIIVSQYGLWY